MVVACLFFSPFLVKAGADVRSVVIACGLRSPWFRRSPCRLSTRIATTLRARARRCSSPTLYSRSPMDRFSRPRMISRRILVLTLAATQYVYCTHASNPPDTTDIPGHVDPRLDHLQTLQQCDPTADPSILPFGGRRERSDVIRLCVLPVGMSTPRREVRRPEARAEDR